MSNVENIINYTKHKRFSTRGATLPRKDLFIFLRDEWINAQQGRTSAKLASWLEIAPQSVATFASKGNKRSAPWWAIMRIVDSLGYEIILRPDEVIVRERAETLKIE